jgi:putative glutamine amidotransferase
MKILISTSQEFPPLYGKAVSLCGGVPTVAYCPDPEQSGEYDGLILAGGGDILPKYFHEEDLGVSTDMDEARDQAELALAKRFLEEGKPILGICRGIQLLNTLLGGALIQDLPDEKRIVHRTTQEVKYHKTTATPGSFLAQLYGEHPLVNSYHHQALDQMGEGFVPCQWSEDGVVEGAYLEGKPVWGVQWHPERMVDLTFNPEGTAPGLQLFEAWMKLIK